MFTTKVSIICNTPNCKTAPYVGTERTATFFAARKDGWECINAAEQFCPTCKAERHPKPAKTEKAPKAETVKGNKAGNKAGKANTKPATKPQGKAPKADAKPAPVAQVGQAVKLNGKSLVAKSAKK